MTKPKKYTIKKSEFFKEQEKLLPKDVKKELDKTLKLVAKDPYNCPHSMSVFGKPSAKELKQWMGDTPTSIINLIIEYLSDKKCLNRRGKKLEKEFWELYLDELEEK